MKRGLVLVLVLLLCTGFASAKVSIKDITSSETDIEEQREEGITRYVYGLNGLVASVSDSDVNYYHPDRLGSNRVVSDEVGAVVEEFKSLPFGQEIKNTGVKFAFATGKELDESDLYYFGARYYDSDSGRFTSVDPIKENHAYSYVRNNPLGRVDPTGMGSVDQTEWDAFASANPAVSGVQIGMDPNNLMSRPTEPIKDDYDKGFWSFWFGIQQGGDSYKKDTAAYHANNANYNIEQRTMSIFNKWVVGYRIGVAEYNKGVASNQPIVDKYSNLRFGISSQGKGGMVTAGTNSVGVLVGGNILSSSALNSLGVSNTNAEGEDTHHLGTVSGEATSLYAGGYVNFIENKNSKFYLPLYVGMERRSAVYEPYNEYETGYGSVANYKPFIGVGVGYNFNNGITMSVNVLSSPERSPSYGISFSWGLK
jgi:RHS repeat-associated protein